MQNVVPKHLSACLLHTLRKLVESSSQLTTMTVTTGEAHLASNMMPKGACPCIG